MLMDNVSNLRLADLILDQSRFSNKLNGHHSVHFLFPIIFILRIFCLIPQHIQVKKKSKGQMYCQEKKIGTLLDNIQSYILISKKNQLLEK